MCDLSHVLVMLHGCTRFIPGCYADFITVTHFNVVFIFRRTKYNTKPGYSDFNFVKSTLSQSPLSAFIFPSQKF